MIIYKATNKANGKIYIGQTIRSLEYRKSQHFRDAKNNKRRTVYFHNAIYKYGEENFEFEIIDTAEIQEELDQKEIYWIKFYKSNKEEFGYNLDSGGKSGGIKSDSTRQKISKKTKENWEDEEISERMRAGLKKASLKWQEKCSSKRVIAICKFCGKEMNLTPYEARNKEYCSIECRKADGKYAKQTQNGLLAANIANQQNIEKQRISIKEEVLLWCDNNKEQILNAKYNNIKNALTPLSELIFEKYDIKDLRSIAKAFNVSTTKELLLKLKEYVL